MIMSWILVYIKRSAKNGDEKRPFSRTRGLWYYKTIKEKAGVGFPM
jgi:hypothetical protein